MIKSIGTAAPVAATTAAAPAAAKQIDISVQNFGTGLTSSVKGNSLTLSGVPHAEPDTYGGMVNVHLNGQKDQGAFAFIPVSAHGPKLQDVANDLAKQLNERSDFKTTVTEGKDGSFTLHFTPKPADVAKLDRAITEALHNRGADNFINTAEAKKIVDIASEGGISKGERASLQNLMMGWTYNSDEIGDKSLGFENPTLSVTAGTEIQKALWPSG